MEKYREESSDEGATRRRMERSLELCAMFKEVGKGNMASVSKILAKFSLQEGVSDIKAKGYFTQLKEAGLIKISKGEKRWSYHSEFEWDAFKVDIS